MTWIKWGRLAILVVSTLLFTAMVPLGIIVAAEPERAITLSTIYPNITITKTQAVSLPIAVANRGKVDENL
ncbi:MAG: hypothetical protein AAB037_06070, partial [Chloroflexota bacterium]